MKITTRQYVNTLLTALLCGAVAGKASAQEMILSPGSTSPTICLPSPNAGDGQKPAPGLPGAPQWPAEGNPAGGQLRSDANDPRWGKAPLTALKFEGLNELNGGTVPANRARYRVMTDNAHETLFVSIQITDDDAPLASDKVYFGIANNAGTIAHAVEINPVAGSPGKHGDPIASSLRFFSFDANNANCRLDDADGDGAPDSSLNECWTDYDQVTQPWLLDVGIWNDNDIAGNGARWVVNFKVDLKSSPLSYIPTQSLRLTMGAHQVNGLLGGLQVVESGTEKLQDGCQNATGTPGLSCLKYFSFFWNPASWTQTYKIDSSNQALCLTGGVRIQKLLMGSRYGDGTDPTDGPANATYLRKRDGDKNTFFIEPLRGNSDVAQEAIDARIRIADWGTLGDSQAGWLDLFDGLAPSPDSAVKLLNPAYNDLVTEFECENKDGNICGFPLRSRSASHQCMQVNLSPSGNGQVLFSQASAYRNMYFEEASEVRETATINTMGMSAYMGREVDLYFHLVTTNMPEANDVPRTDKVDELRALREQVDLTYDDPDVVTCAERSDLCIDSLGYGTTVCHFAKAQLPNGCSGMPEVDLGDDEIYCMRYNEPCLQPPGGGYNEILTAMDPSDVLTEHYPTIIVYPYYDSGKTTVIDGRTADRWVPMPSFGLHLTHEGEYYGWLKTLTAAGLKEFEPGWFKLTAATETTIPMDVWASAEEGQLVELGAISGKALNYASWFSPSVSISATADYNEVIDLSQSTIVVESVLNHAGTELVSNLNGPVTLHPIASADPFAAIYTNNGSPSVSLEVFNIPFLGLVTSLEVRGSSVDRPAGCSLWSFGSATLGTHFTINEQGKPPVSIRGEDEWACVPFSLVN